MALYTILFGLSIFMIALVLAIIKKMFFKWRQEHKIESGMTTTLVERPAVSMIIYSLRTVIRCRTYDGNIMVYDVIDKSDISLTKNELNEPSLPLEQAAEPLQE